MEERERIKAKKVAGYTEAISQRREEQFAQLREAMQTLGWSRTIPESLRGASLAVMAVTGFKIYTAMTLLKALVALGEIELLYWNDSRPTLTPPEATI